MKQFVAAILAILYLGTTTGFVVDAHYCMGKITSVQVDNFAKENCTVCGAVKKSCCRDEIKVVKLNADQKQVSGGYFFKSQEAPLSNFVSAYIISPAEIFVHNTAYANPPPLIFSNNLFLKNCVFRI